MKSVLISILPNWVEKICSGEKTIEVRRTRPNIETPFKVYIYQTKKRWIYKLLPWLKERQAKVIGEFVCDKVDKIVLTARGYMINNDIAYTNKVARESCLYFDDLQKYLGENVGYAWHISDLKIYDEPKNLLKFRKPCIDKYQYCQGCKYGIITLSPDEEEYAMYHGGYYDTFDTVCTNRITRPPQSWQYVEEVEE